MWYDYLKFLDGYFKEKVKAKTVLGRREPSMLGLTEFDKGIIVLYRGDESYKENNIYKCTVYLEVYVRDDSKDLEQGYKKLSELEGEIDTSLTELAEQVAGLNEEYCFVSDNWQMLDIFTTKKQGDFDFQRPFLGSQYTLEANFYLHEQEEEE